MSDMHGTEDSGRHLPSDVLPPEPEAFGIARRFGLQIEACEELLITGWEHRPPGDALVEHYQFILMNIFARSTVTYRAVLSLVRTGYDQQAVMLTRSLFEDVITAYWLALPEHRDEALQRIVAHEEFSALLADDVIRKHPDWTALTLLEDPEFEAKRLELQALFGRHGEKPLIGPLYPALHAIRDLWAKHGNPDDPQHYYAAFQRYANQRLHTTASSLTANLGERSLGRTHYFALSAAPKAEREGTLVALRGSFFSYLHLALLLLDETGQDVAQVESLRIHQDVALTALAPDAPKPKRNAPCPCGSGEKYKNCHGAQ